MIKKKKDKSASEAVKETNETLVFDEYGDIDAQVQAVMEKYDRESNVRHWKGIPKTVIRYLLVAFAVYSILINFAFNWETRIERASFVGCIIVLIFLIFHLKKMLRKKSITCHGTI